MVEFLVAILLTSIIMGAIYGVYRVQTHSVKAQETRLEAQEYARAALDMMVREIRNAAYNPLSATSGTNCASGSAGAPGVVTATTTTFRFTYDFQGTTAGTSPDGHCNGPDEDIEYRFDPTGCPSGFGDIRRKTTNPVSDEALTNCNVPATNGFSLKYYAQNQSSEMSPLVLANIQRVSIELTVQSMNTEAGFGGGQLNAKVTSNVDLRNRGLPS